MARFQKGMMVSPNLYIGKLCGGNSNIFYVHPYLGKIPNLTNGNHSDGSDKMKFWNFNTPEDERLEHVLVEVWFRSFSFLNG